MYFIKHVFKQTFFRLLFPQEFQNYYFKELKDQLQKQKQKEIENLLQKMESRVTLSESVSNE